MRHVVIAIQDDEVDQLDVIGWTPPPSVNLLADSPPEHIPSFAWEGVPVPPDNRLGHAVQLLIQATEASAVSMAYGSFRDRLHDAVSTVRAAFPPVTEESE